jgi:DNA repair protein RadC
MKPKIKFAFMFILLAFGACEKEKPLYDQVMDIHDEVMPKMDELYQLKKGIQEKLVAIDSTQTEKRQQMETTIHLLDSANEAMMVWMREFNPPSETEGEAYTQYMEAELGKVKQMREVVLSALEQGKKQN